MGFVTPWGELGVDEGLSTRTETLNHEGAHEDYVVYLVRIQPVPIEPIGFQEMGKQSRFNSASLLPSPSHKEVGLGESRTAMVRGTDLLVTYVGSWVAWSSGGKLAFWLFSCLVIWLEGDLNNRSHYGGLREEAVQFLDPKIGKLPANLE